MFWLMRWNLLMTSLPEHDFRGLRVTYRNRRENQAWTRVRLLAKVIMFINLELL